MRDQLIADIRALAERNCHRSIAQQFVDNPQHHQQRQYQAGPLRADLSKQLWPEDVAAKFCELARSQNLSDKIQAMYRGDLVNPTEQRAACHNKLRQYAVAPEGCPDDVRSMYEQMGKLVETLRASEFKHLINIGIGGSDLGPRLVNDALSAIDQARFDSHFVSNIDPGNLSEALKAVELEKTLVVVSSKSFTTEETLSNARAVRRVLLDKLGPERIGEHFVVVTAKPQVAADFGVPSERVIAFPNWVGGRFSVWSAIGISIALNYGMERFLAFLAGGAAMDKHFAETPFEQNLPATLAMLDAWYSSFLGWQSLAILPYEHSLKLLPSYLQQLMMESNGKSVMSDGSPLDLNSSATIWGEAGTNGQHSFHQLLHQGTQTIPCDFLLPLQSNNPIGDQHRALVAHCLAQSLALMQGRDEEQVYQELLAAGEEAEQAQYLAKHKAMPGNRPSGIIYFERTSAEVVGAIIALYEHRVFASAALWGINAYDQWGVELGKIMSRDINTALADSNDGVGTAEKYEASTAALIAEYQALQQ